MNEWEIICVRLVEQLRFYHERPWEIRPDWTAELFDANDHLILKDGRVEHMQIAEVQDGERSHLDLSPSMWEKLAKGMIVDLSIRHELPWAIRCFEDKFLVSSSDRRVIFQDENVQLAGKVLEYAVEAHAEMLIFVAEQELEDALDPQYQWREEKKRKDPDFDPGN